MSSENTQQATHPSVLQPELVVVTDPHSAAAQAYRTARASIRNAALEDPVRSVLLVEAGVGDQTGLAAANLATSFALGGEPTVLIDTDSAQPRLHELLNTALAPGVTEWLLARDASERPKPLTAAVTNLQVLPAGYADENSDRSMADLLTSEKCAELIGEMLEHGRFVLVHAPALPASSEALTIASRVDAVLMVIRSGVTKRAHAQQAKASLERVGARMLGAVLTDA